MSATTIEWTDHTLNPGIYGCEEVSPACANCYAAKMAHRQVEMGNYPAGITTKRASGVHWSGVVRVDYGRIGPAFESLPKRKPARVFVTSMADLFHADVPDDFIERVFAEMERREHLTFQVLTKRPERIDLWWRTSVWGLNGYHWPANVWIGTTVEDQKRADERIPHLLRVPAPVRFLSMEPLLGPVDLTASTGPAWENGGTGDEWRAELWACPRCGGSGYHQTDPYIVGCHGCNGNRVGIHWVIAGGESGHHARPTHPAWAASLRDQCAAAGVPFFWKQWGEHGADGRRVGKHAAGRLLDGREHSEFPHHTPSRTRETHHA